MTWRPSERLRDSELQLRPPTSDDIEAVMAVFCDHPDTLRYVAFQPKTTPEEAARFLTILIDGWGQSRPIWFLEREGTVVGSIIAAREGEHVEISYTISPANWGQGLATRAVALVVDECFASSAVRSVHATCDAENLASMRVLEKAGFVEDARLPKHGRHNISTDLRDCVRYRFNRL